MKTLHFFGAIVLAIAGLTATSCSEGKSYAELLNEENMYTNNFLADQIVELEIPADTVFQVGPRAHESRSSAKIISRHLIGVNSSLSHHSHRQQGGNR